MRTLLLSLLIFLNASSSFAADEVVAWTYNYLKKNGVKVAKNQNDQIKSHRIFGTTDEGTNCSFAIQTDKLDENKTQLTYLLEVEGRQSISTRSNLLHDKSLDVVDADTTASLLWSSESIALVMQNGVDVQTMHIRTRGLENIRAVKFSALIMDHDDTICNF